MTLLLSHIVCSSISIPNNSILLSILARSCGLIFLIHFIILGVNFYKKLKMFARNICRGNKKMQTRIHNLMNKLVVCWLFAFSSTVTVCVVGILFNNLRSSQNTSDFIRGPLFFTVLNMDSVINSLALSMQFEFGQTIYGKLCSKYDIKLKNCCDSIDATLDNRSTDASLTQS